MLRQKWGSVVCPSCGNLVGINDEKCFTCGRWNPGLWGFAPLLNRLGRDLGFASFVMSACIGLYAIALITDWNQVDFSPTPAFLAPSIRGLFLLGASGVRPVFLYHRWWTVITAGWLHASLLHIFFNLMWIRQLAPATSEMYGASRMVIIYTIAGIVGFTASTMAGAFGLPFSSFGFTVGASAPIFGLLAALVYYGRRTGSSAVGNQAKTWAIAVFLLGFFLAGTDNWAHFGGFVGGYAAAKFLDPLKPERLDHLIAALVCLTLTGLAIAWSVVDGLRFL